MGGLKRDLTIVFPYYDNAGMLIEQLRSFAALPGEIRTALDVIVVDDCSPKSPALPVVQEHIEHARQVYTFRLYRTLVDRRWNWLFCRNLGMQEATTNWVLMTDIDHLVPEATLRALLTEDLDQKVVYRFSRVDAPDMTPYKPHPNSWLMTRRMFDAIGGYDERFSGFYGTDGEFRDRVHATARAVTLRSDVLVRYPREVIPDASTTTYGRKEEQDRLNVARIRAERAQIKDWRPVRVSFPYERLL